MLTQHMFIQLYCVIPLATLRSGGMHSSVVGRAFLAVSQYTKLLKIACVQQCHMFPAHGK